MMEGKQIRFGIRFQNTTAKLSLILEEDQVNSKLSKLKQINTNRLSKIHSNYSKFAPLTMLALSALIFVGFCCADLNRSNILICHP